jgi:hypothetical protein
LRLRIAIAKNDLVPALVQIAASAIANILADLNKRIARGSQTGKLHFSRRNRSHRSLALIQVLDTQIPEIFDALPKGFRTHRTTPA